MGSIDIANILPNSSDQPDGRKMISSDVISDSPIQESSTKPLKFVKQYHKSGCFIACVAMLTGKTYNEVFEKIHPNLNILDVWRDGYTSYFQRYAALTLDEAIAKLPELGVKATPSPIRTFAELKQQDKHALCIIRWSKGRTIDNGVVFDRVHGMVFDAVAKRVYDPNATELFDIFNYQFSFTHNSYEFYERQLDKVLLID